MSLVPKTMKKKLLLRMKFVLFSPTCSFSLTMYSLNICSWPDSGIDPWLWTSKQSWLEEEHRVKFSVKLSLEEKNYVLQFLMLKDRILHHQMQSKHQCPIHQVRDLDPSMLEETLLCPILQLIKIQNTTQ